MNQIRYCCLCHSSSYERNLCSTRHLVRSIPDCKRHLNTLEHIFWHSHHFIFFWAQFPATRHALRWHKFGRKVQAREQSPERFRRSQPEPCLAIGHNLARIFCLDRYDVFPYFLERFVAQGSPHFSTDPLHREQRFDYEEMIFMSSNVF